jgi:serine/threonine-protein kinase
MVGCQTVIGVGDVVADKYKVEKTLGKGGMGYVVAARHMQLDQQVAIKVLIPELAENEDAVARFLREARAAVKIRSEHIVRVLDVGTLDDGAPFMVMEFLEGRDLAREMEERKRLPVGDAVDYVLQVCEGLAEAHAVGIVHRDLKPANLFITRKSDGTNLVKILDFGISKALMVEGQASPVPITATQGVMGSPHYMSPEQVRKPKTVDTRSDIWSLGVILHEFLTGTPPFASETPMAILAAVVSDEPPEIRSTRFDVPDALQTVVSTCLAKEPSRRYADVVELALALKAFAPGSGDASFNRISAILRTAKDRSASVPKPLMWPSSAPTLESGNAPPMGPDEKTKNTEAGWGSSQAGSRQSRTRMIATITAGAAALAFAAAVGYSVAARSGRDAAITTATGASIGAPPTPTAPPIPAPSSIAAPTITPAPEKPVVIEAQEAGAQPTAARDAGVAVTVQAAAASPKSAPIAQTPPVTTPLQKPPATKRDEKPVAPKPRDEKPAADQAKEGDPLDGRR